MPEPSAVRTTPRLGAKIRALRRQAGLSQVQMAERLAISPSYLNLIEANKRPLTANLLIHLANSFQVDLKTFAPDSDQRLAEDLMEAFGDSLFEPLDLPAAEVRDLAHNDPAVARAVFLLLPVVPGGAPAHGGPVGPAERRPGLSGRLGAPAFRGRR